MSPSLTMLLKKLCSGMHWFQSSPVETFSAGPGDIKVLDLMFEKSIKMTTTIAKT
jgi:hypothetical protein